MLGSFFAAKAKLQVKDGKMTLTMLNTGSARMMLDFTIGKDGTYPTAKKKGYGEADAQVLIPHTSTVWKSRICQKYILRQHSLP